MEGRGQRVRISGSTGQYTKGIEFSFTEPFFLGYRLAAGIDLFSKYSDNVRTAAYVLESTGGTLRLGVPITDEFSIGTRYSLFTQRISVPNTTKRPYGDCTTPTNPVSTGPGADGIPGNADDITCLTNSEASVAVKQAQGRTLTSLIGLSAIYSTLDNPRDPRNGLLADARVDFAGLGGDSKYVRTSGDIRYYHELFEEVVGSLRVQGGVIHATGDGALRIIDHNFMGPNLVRGFAPSGIGPRDITYTSNHAQGALGATT